MADRRQTLSPRAGRADMPEPARITTIEIVSLILSVFWLALSAVVFLVLVPKQSDGESGGAFRFVIVLMVVFLPVAMIWVGAMAARSARVIREESQRLQAAIDAIRQAYITQSRTQAVSTGPTVARKLDEIATSQRKTETALAMFSSSRPSVALPMPVRTQAAQPESDDQVALPLGTPADEIQPPLAHQDFIRALNFPETAEDKAGFAALRRALRDRPTAQLVQASQDVLTLLSQDGIYMDDLRPDMARPEIWRRFAAGERGRQIAALGGVRDRSSLALTAARMRSDPIFRDAAHHFLRRFDRTFADFANRASDAELSELSETRTARAFMLLGRVAGTFD